MQNIFVILCAFISDVEHKSKSYVYHEYFRHQF